MSINEILNKQIENYLLENPIDRSQDDPYGIPALVFSVEKEKIRDMWRKLRKEGKVEKDNPGDFAGPSKVAATPAYQMSTKSDTVEITKETKKEIKNEKDLIEECEIDLNEWKVAEWDIRRYNSWFKDENNQIQQQPLYSIYAKLKRRTIDNDPKLQKQELLNEIKKYISEQPIEYKIPQYEGGGLLLELSAPDLHLGKLAWGEETGEDYDIKIACQRYIDSIRDLLSKVPLDAVERILLPIGNDMITIDSAKNMTTAGTPQHADSRFRKILLTTKTLLVSIIDTLVQIAPVDVVVVSGNHDYDAMFTVGMVLEAFYHEHPHVNIDNTPTQRKYYQFHTNGIMFTHGNEEKHHELGLIFATEQPQLWADTLYREVHLGHFHKNKKINYVSVDEYQGFQIQVIPSLSGIDAWHNTKGYNTLKQAKAFLYDKEDGKVGEFTYTVKK